MTDKTTYDFSQPATTENRPRSMVRYSPILQVQQNLRDAEKRIDELTTSLAAAKERNDELAEKLIAAKLSQNDEWDRAERAEADRDRTQQRYNALLTWSQAALQRLVALMATDVSNEQNEAVAAIVADAPEAVKEAK